MAALELINNGVIEDYRFHCKSCKQTLPTLENIDKKLTLIGQKQELRLVALEEKVKRIEL